MFYADPGLGTDSWQDYFNIDDSIDPELAQALRTVLDDLWLQDDFQMYARTGFGLHGQLSIENNPFFTETGLGHDLFGGELFLNIHPESLYNSTYPVLGAQEGEASGFSLNQVVGHEVHHFGNPAFMEWLENRPQFTARELEDMSPKEITAYLENASREWWQLKLDTVENPAVDYENELLSDHYPGLQPPRADYSLRGPRDRDDCMDYYGDRVNDEVQTYEICWIPQEYDTGEMVVEELPSPSGTGRGFDWNDLPDDGSLVTPSEGFAEGVISQTVPLP